MAGRHRRLGRWLGSGAPPSARAALFLALSMFFCGCVVAGFVFVGIWRHTATEKAQTLAAEQSVRRQLLQAEVALAGLKKQLAHNQRLLARTQRQANHATVALAATRDAKRALARSLASRLHKLVEAASSVAGQSATIESEISALESYARRPGAAGVDPGYLATQTRYLARSASGAAAATAALAEYSRNVQTILTTTDAARRE